MCWKEVLVWELEFEELEKLEELDWKMIGCCDDPPLCKNTSKHFWFFWFLCGNGVYTDSFFSKIVLKVFLGKYFTIL